MFGVRLSEVFGWHRHHFDRLVHFAYGLCATMVPRLGAVRSLEVVAATSALYELFEWGVAVVLAPGMAEAYNGQQGDVRDAHKDMTMAPLGAVAAVLALGCRRGPGRVATEQAQGPRPTV
ncbi:DUF2238 domain-containing protein [Actinophytocola oryzae]|uniref:DUF2238 domain-containing protein n=1 Tax=Actinophytocola oryzae TaxID=502181 RepID=UPI00141504B6|nr:DUF2238 domain-containing protein [Actinophytocola oryzae]